MAFGKNSTQKGGASDLIIQSVGICAAVCGQKSKDDLVIVAYMPGSRADIKFTALKYPAKNVYGYEDILYAIREAEGVKNVTYSDGNGHKRDIYVCRELSGKIFDPVSRDAINNRFAEGFAEITSSRVKFTINDYNEAFVKAGAAFSLSIVASLGKDYEKNSYEYAIVNAFNACLLGEVFTREEFDFETRGGKKIKSEVKCSDTEFLSDDTLIMKPVLRDDGFAEYYVSEEFNLYDGRSVSKQSYKIIYSMRLEGYNLIKQ